MEEHPDNVSNIHNRFSLTLLNPSSHYFSLAASLAIAVVISLTTYLGYLGHVAFDDVWYRIPLVVAVLALTQLLDTRFTRKKEYSKSLHSSLFANMLWVVTILMGLLASLVLDKEPSLFFVTFWHAAVCKLQDRHLHHHPGCGPQKSLGHMPRAAACDVPGADTAGHGGRPCSPTRSRLGTGYPS